MNEWVCALPAFLTLSSRNKHHWQQMIHEFKQYLQMNPLTNDTKHEHLRLKMRLWARKCVALYFAVIHRIPCLFELVYLFPRHIFSIRFESTERQCRRGKCITKIIADFVINTGETNRNIYKWHTSTTVKPVKPKSFRIGLFHLDYCKNKQADS